MTTKQREKYLLDFKKYLERETATKEKSSQFLQRLGVHTRSGRLTKNFS